MSPPWCLSQCSPYVEENTKSRGQREREKHVCTIQPHVNIRKPERLVGGVSVPTWDTSSKLGVPEYGVSSFVKLTDRAWNGVGMAFPGDLMSQGYLLMSPPTLCLRTLLFPLPKRPRGPTEGCCSELPALTPRLCTITLGKSHKISRLFLHL